MLPTTVAHPTSYRPDPYGERYLKYLATLPEDDPRMVQWNYMEDWGIANGNHGPLMPGIPVDYTGDAIGLDTDVEEILRWLQDTWEASRLVEGIEA